MTKSVWLIGLLSIILVSCAQKDPVRQSLKEISSAVKSHDWDKFQKYVDVEAVANHYFDDMVKFLEESTKGEDTTFLSGFVTGLTMLMKPTLINSFKTALKDLVLGEVSPDTEMYQTLSEIKWSDLDKRVKSIKKEGAKAIVTIATDSLNINLRMNRIGDVWKLTAIDFYGLLQTVISKEEKAISKEGGKAQHQEIDTTQKIVQKAKKAYLDSVIVRNVHVGETVLGGKGVFGEIKNIGSKTLKEVEITVYCLDKQGKPVYEKKFHPVLVIEFFPVDNEPLKPNYSRKFGYRLDDAPSDWAGKVKVVITNVEFQVQ